MSHFWIFLHYFGIFTSSITFETSNLERFIRYTCYNNTAVYFKETQRRHHIMTSVFCAKCCSDVTNCSAYSVTYNTCYLYDDWSLKQGRGSLLESESIIIIYVKEVGLLTLDSHFKTYDILYSNITILFIIFPRTLEYAKTKTKCCIMFEGYIEESLFCVLGRNACFVFKN